MRGDSDPRHKELDGIVGVPDGLLSERELTLLGEAGASTFDDLLRLVTSTEGDFEAQATAAHLLGRLGQLEAVPPLLVALDGPSSRLGCAAAQALGNLRDERAVRPLITVLRESSDPEIRKRVVFALGQLGGMEALDALIETVDKLGELSDVRGMAAEALALFPDSWARERLRQALSDDTTEVRFWAIFALGELGDRASLADLRRIARDDKGQLAGWGSVAEEARSVVARLRCQ